MKCAFCPKILTEEDNLITCCNKCFEEKVEPKVNRSIQYVSNEDGEVFLNKEAALKHLEEKYLTVVEVKVCKVIDCYTEVKNGSLYCSVECILDALLD
jgi:hypothetical protein